ncbi:MAG: DUF3786 domain-containing protein [Candidatus Brocadiae bacterium]|nr:DUF3786 domain-containing protein [Candidatus Brocadiia bacterium]
MRLPKQDHYEVARDAALHRLRQRADGERLLMLGARHTDSDAAVTLPVLCWELRIQMEPFAMSLLPGGDEVALPWQILALDYLCAREPVPPTGFVSFADFAEGRSYLPAFRSRVTDRLSHTVGRDKTAFIGAAERLGAKPVGGDPVMCIFRFFPLLDFQVARYEADDEFPASCDVLYPDNTLAIFTLEDGIVAAEKLVAALEGKGPAVRAAGRPVPSGCESQTEPTGAASEAR